MKRRIAPFGDGTIVLRLVERRDLETILEWRNRDDARVWFKTSDRLTLERHLAWYEGYLRRDDDFFFLVEADGRPVGQCGIYDIDGDAGRAEIGRFLVAPEMAGKGYITRSCAQLVRFGGEILNLPYLFLEVMEENTKAIRIYTRTGFVEEGRAGGIVRMGLMRSSPKMISNRQLCADWVTSLRLWRVWTFLGVQDIKARFRRSFIGPLWILLNLALFVGGAGSVYGVMLGLPMDEFLPFLITGITIWGFLLSSFTEAGSAFVGSEGYIKQFSYPKQIYLLRALVAYGIILLIGLSAIALMQIFLLRFDIVGWLIAIPGLVLLLLAALGQIVISAYLGTRFRGSPSALVGLLQVIFCDADHVPHQSAPGKEPRFRLHIQSSILCD